MNLRRKSDFPHANVVTGLFYYISVIALVSMMVVGIAWQLEIDPNTFEKTESTVISKESNRSFFVSLVYCTPDSVDLRITRHYLAIENNVYYTVPDGVYQTANGCSTTRIQGHTGRLDPGRYEYRVFGTYRLNPLREEKKLLAVVKVIVE